MKKQAIDSLTAAWCEGMGIMPPNCASPANRELIKYIDSRLEDKRLDRVFIYNPDAIGKWIFEKYSHILDGARAVSELELELLSVMPCVTPVCFGTIYTGAMPSIHGITTYAKPVIKTDSIFDALLRATKRPAIVCTEGDSLSRIFLERKMDYFFYPTEDEVNRKAEELILADEHDLIVVYNDNYDTVMHKHGPESDEALAALKANNDAYCRFVSLIKERWSAHNTLVGFAMDHGCHAIDGDCGSHGLDMPEDMEIVHLYNIFDGNTN